VTNYTAIATPATLTMDEALAALGVTDQTLTPQQRQDLDERGFTIFYNVMDPG
jgi:hypothetical protein